MIRSLLDAAPHQNVDGDFFTDQYDLGMEYTGHVGPQGYDEVVIRGSLIDRTFTALWISADHVAAGMHVNDWDATGALRDLVGRKATAAVRDTSVTLKDAHDG